MSEITFKLKTPTVPNFIIIDNSCTGKRQDGFRESPKVALGDLTEKQIDDLAENFRLAMHDRAKIQRKSPVNR
jgi:hypothetical protein